MPDGVGLWLSEERKPFGGTLLPPKGFLHLTCNSASSLPATTAQEESQGSHSEQRHGGRFGDHTDNLKIAAQRAAIEDALLKIGHRQKWAINAIGGVDNPIRTAHIQLSHSHKNCVTGIKRVPKGVKRQRPSKRDDLMSICIQNEKPIAADGAVEPKARLFAGSGWIASQGDGSGNAPVFGMPEQMIGRSAIAGETPVITVGEARWSDDIGFA